MSKDPFKIAIEKHLENVSKEDPEFKAKFNNPKKSIDDCIKYILNQVEKSGRQGFEDSEIYGMALHYYDEEKVDVGKNIKAKVVVNHAIELTEKDKEQALKEAKERLIASEMERMKKKPQPKKESKPSVAPSLFD